MIRPISPLFVLALGVALTSGAVRLAEADTVYLKNGSFINCVVVARETSVILRIGNYGQVEIPNDEVYKIERNKLTGAEGGVTVSERESETGDDPEEKDEGEEVGSEQEGQDPAEKPREKSADGTNDGSDVPESAAGAEGGAPQPPPEESLDPKLVADIAKHVADLQSTNPKHRIRAEGQLRSIGTPAVPSLVPLLRSDGELTRIAIARILADTGDDRAVDALIEALLDSNEYVRDYANKGLKRITREDFGFGPNASPRRREASRLKWFKWWEQEKAERERERAAESAESAIAPAARDRDDEE